MVGDEPFGRFLDELLTALQESDRIRRAGQMSIEDLDSAMTTPVSPQLSSGFDVSSSPERRLVESVRVAGGTHLLDRAARRDFLAQPTVAVMQAFAVGMIEADSDLSSSLSSVVATGAPDRRVAAVFFTLLHMPLLVEMVSRRLNLVYWLEGHAGLTALVATAPRPPLRERLRTMFRALRRSRNQLTEVVNQAISATRDFHFVHQLFIEKQLEALLQQRHDWRNQLTEVSVVAVAPSTPPTPGEIALYQRWYQLGEAIREAQRRVTDQVARIRAMWVRHRASVQPERGRIYTREIEPGEATQRSLENDVSVLQRQQAALNLSRETRERVERFLAAERAGERNAELADDRDEMLRSLDSRLGLTAPTVLFGVTDEQRWRSYRAVLASLVDESRSDLNTHNFSFSFLAACRSSEIERDIGMTRTDQAEFQWITRPGHAREAVDMNGPRRDVVVTRPDRFVVPSRFTLPAGLARDPQHRETTLLRAEVTNERQDLFGKLANGLLGSARARSNTLDDYFAEHGRDRIAPRELRDQTFNTRQLELIILALFASNLTSVNNLTALRALRAGLAERLNAEITAEVGLAASAELVNSARANAGGAGRFSISNAMRGVVGVDATRMLTALRAILRRTAGASGDPLPLLDSLWRFLVALHRAGAELRTGGGAVTLRHRYEFSEGQSLTVDILYSHLFRIGSFGTTVAAGDFIGEVGATGSAANIHLHIEFEVRLGSDLLGYCYPHEFFPMRRPENP